MTAPRYRVAVVGFGIAGAAAATLLARSGHAVTLFERAPVVGPIGAGLLLQPAGQAILRRMGLFDLVMRSAAPVEELHAVRRTGGTLIRLGYADLEPGCRAFGVHRGVLFSALAHAVQSEPIDVRLGCEIVRLDLGGDVTGLVDQAGHRHGPFDVIVAADGSRSRFRRTAALPCRVHEYDHGALWLTGRCSAVRDKLYQVCQGTRHLLGILSIGGGLCSLYWGVPCRELAPVRARGIRAFKDELRAFCPESAELVEPVTALSQLVFTTYRHVWMRRWFSRQVVVIGDAAHATSPHLGQGGGLALRDAWELARALNTSPDRASAFRAYARRRAAHVRYYSSLTYLLSPFFQGDGRVRGRLRDLALPWMPRVPWVRRQMLLTMAGLKAGWLGDRVPG